MIFDERTIYLFHVIKAGEKEFYKGFEWSQATNAILHATNDQEMVEHIIRRMNSCEATQASSIKREQQVDV